MNTQIMGIISSFVEQKMGPIADWLIKSGHIAALRDGFQLAMPFIIVGSLLVPIISPPISAASTNPLAVLVHHLSLHLTPIFSPIYNHTAGLISLIIAFGSSSSLAKTYNIPERLTGLCGCVSFLLLIDFSSLQGTEHLYLAGLSIFTALLVSLYTVEIIRLFHKSGWVISFPDEVPLMTKQGFQLIIPLLFITTSLSLLRLWIKNNIGLTVPELMSYIFNPLITGADTLPALLLALLVTHLLWFIGVHGTLIVNGILSPFWMACLINNQNALMNGEPLPHIFLQGFWDYYCLIGGVGTTLPLILMAIRSRSRTLKTVGRVGMFPSIFNINEPILFGFPIIMNPIFLIPFILAPIFNATLAWYFSEWGYLGRFIAMLPWSMPAPLGATWATNGNWSNLIMVAICIINSYFIYRPFFLLHEKMLLSQENSPYKT